MKNKREFFESGHVMSIASNLESCLKVCHHLYIDWEVLVEYLWKNKEVREKVQDTFIRGMSMQEIADLGKKIANEDFKKYFVVKLRK